MSASDDETLMTRAGAGSAAAAVSLERGDTIGRYVVLNRLGAGGMGIVYAAYDPELDRRVALKLLRTAPGTTDGAVTSGTKRLLREAQSMAKLSHPNVVAIHDVGEHEGSVFLAMEFIDGMTLGQWLAQTSRRWRAVLDVFVRAGRGLEAAHAKGLIHRDFKPDNVLIDGEGRVRVLDFGLARTSDSKAEPRDGAGPEDPIAELEGEVRRSSSEDLTRQGALVGTPAYMAPEQWRGDVTDARTDQFAFCIALWEGVFGERPFAAGNLQALALAVTEGRLREPGRGVPPWMRHALLRGLSTRPQDRFSSMQDLLAVLERGQARRRARVGVAAVVIVAALLTLGLGFQRLQRVRATAVCQMAGTEIEEVLSQKSIEKVRQGLLGSGFAAAEVTANKVVPWLEEHAASWARTKTAVCMASDVDQTMAPRVADEASGCLDERRVEFEALIEELSNADTALAIGAVRAVATLNPPTTCVDPGRSSHVPDIPPHSRQEAHAIRLDLARARVLLDIGRSEKGRAILEPILPKLEELGSPSLVAEIHRIEALALESEGDYEGEELGLRRAYFEAAAAGAWEVAASTAIVLTDVVGRRLARHDEGRVWAEHGRVALVHAGDPLGLQESARLDYLGAIEASAANYDEAARLHQRSLGIRQTALGDEHPLVATTLNNLGNVYYQNSEYAEAAKYYDQALLLKESALGADHPELASTLSNLGNIEDAEGRPDKAKEFYERSLAISRHIYDEDHPQIAAGLTNLGKIEEVMGNPDEAIALYEQAIPVWERTVGPDHPNLAITRSNLANVYGSIGRNEEAKALLELSVQGLERSLGPEHPQVAVSLDNLAVVVVELGEIDTARALKERSLAIREAALGPDHPEVAYALVSLAADLLARGDYERARALAQRALTIQEEKLDPGSPELANSSHQLGRALLALDDATGALPHLERAVSVYERQAGTQELEPGARYWLARGIVEAGGDRSRARALAEQALEQFVAAGEGQKARRSEVEAWLAAQRWR